MKRILLTVLSLSALLGSGAKAEEQGTVGVRTKPSFTFREVGYFHRWSKDNQHEFTPDQQKDLTKWADMVTLNAYPDVSSDDELAAKANAVLENYKKHQAIVLKTASVPRTRERPAEHLIAVAFGRPTFIEVAFARFKLADGKGSSAVYSHRLYGEKIGDQMSAWLEANGPAVEKALMESRSLPSPNSLSKELLRTRS